VFVSLFVPVLIGTGASTDPYTKWSDGYFVQLASEIVGPWLSYWLIFAAAITNIGMFEAEMSSDSWQIAGMAERGILPKVLGKRSVHDTPIYGILISASGVLCLCWMSFSEVIDMLNLLFCFGQAIEFFAFLELRRSKPNMPRPFRIGIGFVGMCFVLLFPLTFIVVILYFSSTKSLVLSFFCALLGVGVYYILEIAKTNKLCVFEDKFDSNNVYFGNSDSSASNNVVAASSYSSPLDKANSGYYNGLKNKQYNDDVGEDFESNLKNDKYFERKPLIVQFNDAVNNGSNNNSSNKSTSNN
jgi:amino acid transporter